MGIIFIKFVLEGRIDDVFLLYKGEPFLFLFIKWGGKTKNTFLKTNFFFSCLWQ